MTAAPVSFRDRLVRAWTTTGSLLCVGLDPAPERFPPAIRGSKTPFLDFGKRVVDATRDVACAYKPQIAYYAAAAAERELEQTIAYIRDVAPNAIVVLDAKRGDIGSTAELYAREAFSRYGADCVTVNPYLGSDSLQPFLRDPTRGAVVLCRTSNPSARELQDIRNGDEPVYMTVARKAAADWNGHRNVMLVVGATYPDELAAIRKVAGDVPFLVPGIGEQGGDLERSVAGGMTADGQGLLINSARGIIYAGDGSTAAIRAAASTLHAQINAARAKRH